MTCIVYSDNKEKAIEKLEEIKNTKGNITHILHNSAGTEYRFEDGENWQWRRANENSRACKPHKAWIDKDINKDALHLIVLPCCTFCGEDIFYW